MENERLIFTKCKKKDIYSQNGKGMTYIHKMENERLIFTKWKKKSKIHKTGMKELINSYFQINSFTP